MHEPEFEHVLAQGRALQERLREFQPVVVGGTAVALHCGHRFSLDVDVVTPFLEPRFDEVHANLAQWEGWRTNRINRPVLILGERAGVELGVRQLRRAVPLQTTQHAGLCVATPGEMLRVKAFLLSQRRAARDFVDVAALTTHLGHTRAIEELSLLNLVYGPRTPQSWITLFAEACETGPTDRAAADLKNYRGLKPPFDDWAFVERTCTELGRALLKLELKDALPIALPQNWTEFHTQP